MESALKKCNGQGSRRTGRRTQYVLISCAACGKVFEKPPGFLRLHPQKYCSPKCRGAAGRSERVLVKCRRCGREFEVRPDRLARGKGKFCSRDCFAAHRVVPGARWTDSAKVAEYMREYVQKNREAHNAQSRQWRRANLPKRLALSRARRAGERSGSFTPEEWEDMKRRYGACLCCGRAEPDVKLEADHVVPLAKGGAHSAKNIQPLCRRCNATKGTMVIDYRPRIIE